MRTAILVPVMRGHLVAALVRNIEATTPEPHETFLMATPDVEALYAGADGEFRSWMDEGGTWGSRLNAMWEKIEADFDYVFCGADDVLFHEGWLTNAVAAQEKIGQGIVMPNDLCSIRGTLPFISRAYIREFGSCTVDHSGLLIHQGYHHNFAERETVDTAAARGRYAYCPESVVEHLHWMAGKADRSDPVYVLGESRWDEDLALFSSRQHLWSHE